MRVEWVPLNDLGRAVAEQGSGLTDAVSRVVSSGWFVLGPEGTAFEEQLARYLGVAAVAGVANGTDALDLAVRVGMPPGRTAGLTAANAGGYATTAIKRAGYQVVLADVDASTHCLDVPQVEAALADRPDVGVVVVTHLYGRLAPVAAIRAVCHRRGIRVVEDCAQALGARGPDGAAGSLGDLATFSFYPTKNLGALGDGGAVATGDPELMALIRALRQYGWDTKYSVRTPGGCNSRLDELQAAVLAFRLPALDAWNATRRAILARYAAAAGSRVRVLPADGPTHVAHLAIVETAERAALADAMAGYRIRTDVHYPVPDHRQPGWQDAFGGPRLPVTEALAERILTLPLFPEMREDEIERVCTALERFG